MPPELPSANVSVSETAGASASGTGLLVVMCPVAQNADMVPRYYRSTQAILDRHGYSKGASYSATHFEETRKPVLFIGLPIATAAVIGRQDSSGVTGTCVITVAAAASGIVEEVDAIVRVTKGGTIGTDQIALSISLDGGRTFQAARLGTANTYAIPYVGLVLSFAAGTLAIDDEYSFTTTEPKWNQAAIDTARANLAAQKRKVRTWLLMGDVATEDEAQYVVDEANQYETQHRRFIRARVNVRDRLPLAEMSRTTVRMTGAPSITFAEVGATGDTVDRSAGSFVTDGFVAGMAIDISGSGSNNFTKAKITAVTATRLTLDTQDLVVEGPTAGVTIVGSHGLTFAEVGGTGDTITRSGGSWFDDGFRVGDTVTVALSAGNNVTGAITALTATVMTFGATDLATEFTGTKDVTIVKGETMAAWAAAMNAEFADIDDEPRISIGLGRARKSCPITGYKFRRPAAWAASIREYQHDVHIATYRKEHGKLDGWDLEDTEGTVVEFDEVRDSGGLDGRFTCLRTWENGPEGTFVALDLTRALASQLRSRSQNADVANLACSIVQAETEYAIGIDLELNDDGTASEDSLIAIEERVNGALERELLSNKGEGKRASSAIWKAERGVDLSDVDAEMPGFLDLRLKKTVERINTSVRIR